MSKASCQAAKIHLDTGVSSKVKACQSCDKAAAWGVHKAAVLPAKSCALQNHLLLSRLQRRTPLAPFVPQWSRQRLRGLGSLPDSSRKGVRRPVGVCHASATQSTPEEKDFFVKNEGAVRSLPLVAGGLGGLLVVLNRAFSGIAAVADASSAQSRADVLVLVLAATLLLTGLVWKSVQSRKVVPVELEGVSCLRIDQSLPSTAQDELLWAWDLLQKATRCRSLIVVYRNKVALQAGIARASERSDEPAEIDVTTLLKGKISSAALLSGKANYYANLVLFPGRFEFLAFLPLNTQGLIVQPLGDEGLLLAATDTIRGFVPKDQAWIATLAEKLDTTLASSEAAADSVQEGGRLEQTPVRL